jgi:hypothetical protein
MRARLACAAASLAALLVPAHALAGPPPGVTFVGDSVSASIGYVPAARATLARGATLRLDLAVCRRLVVASCPYRGTTPPTALQAVESSGRSLGDVLIVDVGYNEGADWYAPGIDRVMRAALAGGAKAVVWVTLRETSPIYRGTNAAIRAAARRWPQLVVADWNAYSRGRPWFRGDGLHLTPEGAEALASFLHGYVARAAAAA